MKLLYNESATILPKRVKGVLYSFHQNVWRLSLFRGLFSGFHVLSLLVTTTLQMRTPSHFWAISPSPPKNRGKSRRIQSRDIKHILYPRLFVKYEPFSCIGPYYRPTERTNKINNVRVCLGMSHRACFYSWECRPH